MFRTCSIEYLQGILGTYVGVIYDYAFYDAVHSDFL